MTEENKEEILIPILLEDLGMVFATEKSKQKRRFGLYKCGFCGNEFRTQINSVKNGDTKSCGCYNIKRLRERFIKHGLYKSKLYRIWRNIKDRVLNPKKERYINYGGRGITICEEWKNDFMSFYNWAMGNGYSDELSIDRIDNDGNYCPENCRWTTPTIQARNQRVYKNNKSGYKGVNYHKSTGKYQASIMDGKQKYLGLYPTAEEGAIAYNNYIIENNLEGFILNEIPEEYRNAN